MTPKTRLMLVAVIVLGSTFYAYIIAFDKDLAYAVALWYIAVLLTIMVAIHVGKKMYDRENK